MSVNKVILVGRLGKDPELKTLNSGSNICNMSLATSSKRNDKEITDCIASWPLIQPLTTAKDTFQKAVSFMLRVGCKHAHGKTSKAKNNTQQKLWPT